MLKKLLTFNSQDVEMNRLMDNLDYALNPLFQNPTLDYNIVQNVQLQIGDNIIDHKLGREPIGWYIVRKRGAGNFYDKQDTNTLPSKNIIINSDSSVSVDFYFF